MEYNLEAIVKNVDVELYGKIIEIMEDNKMNKFSTVK